MSSFHKGHNFYELFDTKYSKRQFKECSHMQGKFSHAMVLSDCCKYKL